MRRETRGWSRGYADALNEQLLLNLARLENNHPPYYLAIGAINNKFKLGGDVSAGGSRTETDNISREDLKTPANNILRLAERTLTAAGEIVGVTEAGASLSGETTPDFQLIPLSSDSVAKQFFDPLKSEVFYTLYQQGFPIDQLMRVMVERVEYEDGQVSNSPVRGGAEGFSRFLRMCEVLRIMQREGAIILQDRSEFLPLGADINGGLGVSLNPPTPEQLVAAKDKGLVWQKEEDGAWRIGAQHDVPTFYLRTKEAAIVRNKLAKLDDPRLLGTADDVISKLKQGLAVYQVKRGKGQVTRLILRSFNRAMEAVATEQAVFDQIEGNKSIGKIPIAQRHPVLRTLWPTTGGKLRPPLQKLVYQGKTYQITDPDPSSFVAGDALDPVEGAMGVKSSWNRDVFKLLVALNSQVAVDISKFQRPVVELR